ncbi:MAG: crossover junction endodeoxyribonuclease RuvC [Alkalispirochaeta sp.]
MPVILGIDPGLAATGYGVIRAEAGRYAWIEHGVIRTSSSDRPGVRLNAIAGGLGELILRVQPHLAGVESLFFTKNISSALPVAQARGVVLLTLEQHGIVAEEYTPQIIKQAVVGAGQADKEQVIQMVRIILGLAEAPRPDHAADALAAAITRFNLSEAPRVQ